jgi:signal transduction histidine kinase
MGFDNRFTTLPWRSRLPRRTIRLRLTLLYGGLFLLSGVGLLATTYVLVRHATAGGVPRAGQASPPGQQDAPKRIGSQVAKLEGQAARQHTDQMHQLVVQSAIALGLMSVVSIGLGWVVAGRVLRPLSTITRAARESSATNLHRRLALDGPDDELKELGDTFDELLDRLEASFQSQRRFVANASHELRTPLARQRALVQVALSDPNATVDSLRTVHERVLVATEQQEHLIDALLTLARGERGLDRRQPLDLAEVAGQVLLARDTDATRRGVHLAPTLRHAPAIGDPRLLERLVANLVDNALRYNLASGRLEVSTGTRAGDAVLSVTNTGPVVPADQVDRLFQPFQRLSEDRTRHDGGLGLGLSIVHAIATAHGATVRAQPRPAGGMAIMVTFPRPGGLPGRHDPGGQDT